MTFTVTASSSEIDAIIDARIAAIDAELAEESDSAGFGPNASHEVFGTCGSSKVILRTTTSQSQGQAYVEASFFLYPSYVWSTGAYETDVLVYSNSHSDLWTAHLQDSGANLDGLSWKKGTRYTVPKTQDYGAHFYVGNVAVQKQDRTSGTCSTLGPRVDNVRITVTR